MMTTEVLLEKCHRLAESEPVELNADSLIGFFQTFRPDGAALAGLFDDLDAGDQLHDRLQQLYRAAGDDRRPDGVRDAYFVVRRPPPIDSGLACKLAQPWFKRLAVLPIVGPRREIPHLWQRASRFVFASPNRLS